MTLVLKGFHDFGGIDAYRPLGAAVKFCVVMTIAHKSTDAKLGTVHRQFRNAAGRNVDRDNNPGAQISPALTTNRIGIPPFFVSNMRSSDKSNWRSSSGDAVMTPSRQFWNEPFIMEPSLA